MTPTQRLIALLKPNSKEIINLYLFSLVKAFIALSLPLGIQAIINLIQGGEVSVSWVVLVSIVLIGYLLNGLIQMEELKIAEGLQRDIFARSAFDFAFRIPRIKMIELHNKYTPELINRFFDTVSVQKGVAKILLDLVGTALSIIFGLLLISFYHPFFIIFSFLVILLVYTIGKYVFNSGLKSSIAESKNKYKIAFWLEELARTQNVFRLSLQSMLPIQNTDILVNDYLTTRERHFKILLRQYYIFLTFKLLVAAGFLVLGGILVFNQQMNLGQFVASEIIILQLLNASEKAVLSLETVYDLLTSIEKLGEVMDLSIEDESGAKIIPNFKSHGMSLEIKDLTFSYPDENTNILNGLNMEISSGQVVSLVGTSGSGKATLLKLLTAFFKPNQGIIKYDDILISDYNVVQLRSILTECISDSNIFHGTLYQNLTLSNNSDITEVKNVLDIVNLKQYIDELPEGLHTVIGPQGKTLSGSFTQKVILARNLLKNPRFLIIEDIFKSLDRNEKIEIFSRILEQYKGTTILFITKDKYIHLMTEKTFYMKKGKIERFIYHKN